MPVSTKQYQLIFNPELYNKHYIELDKLIAPLIGQFEDLGLHSYHIKNTWKLSGTIEQDQLDKLVSQQVKESLVNYHQKILSKYSLNLTNKYCNITNKWHKDWKNACQKNHQSKNSIQHLFKFIYFNNHFTTDGHDSYLYKLINEQNQTIIQIRWPRDLNNKGYANKAIKKELKHYCKHLTNINNLFKSLNTNGQSLQSLISSLNQTSRLINKAFQTQANANKQAFSSIANQKQQIAQNTHIMHVAHKLEVELPFCTKSDIHISKKHLLPFKRYQKKLFNKEIQKILGSNNPIETLRNKFGIQLVLVTSQKDELLIIDLIEDGETATDDKLQETWLKTFIKTESYQSFLNQKSIKDQIPVVDLCDSKTDPDGNITMHKLIDDMIMLSVTNRIQHTANEYQFSILDTYWAIINNNKQILSKPIESKRLKSTKTFFK